VVLLVGYEEVEAAVGALVDGGDDKPVEGIGFGSSLSMSRGD